MAVMRIDFSFVIGLLIITHDIENNKKTGTQPGLLLVIMDLSHVHQDCANEHTVIVIIRCLIPSLAGD